MEPDRITVHLTFCATGASFTLFTVMNTVAMFPWS